ncbi:MAG: helix-turn-helix domain-containing protein, partial [Sandaracinaceae bacterium]|nr:helix-turn-helix domain-containing protein [Sandaracinaceae bacterium]
APSQASVEDEPRPPPPDNPPTTPFTGPRLKARRLAAGLRREDISKRTKIRIHYLEAIEEEQFERLPPPVYVRGFVFEIAKILKTDPLQAARTYVRRYQEFLNSRGRLNTT